MLLFNMPVSIILPWEALSLTLGALAVIDMAEKCLWLRDVVGMNRVHVSVAIVGIFETFVTDYAFIRTCMSLAVGTKLAVRRISRCLRNFRCQVAEIADCASSSGYTASTPKHFRFFKNLLTLVHEGERMSFGRLRMCFVGHRALVAMV